MVTVDAAISKFLSGYASGKLEPHAAQNWVIPREAPVCNAFHVDLSLEAPGQSLILP
jgi:hypothetical protein